MAFPKSLKNYLLLVEDDDIDVLSLKKAYKKLGIDRPITVAVNGEEALSIMQERDRDLPFLIILDLNMPKMNGIEFLRVAKKNPIWRHIPVIVFTSSKDSRDLDRCYNESIAGYIVKPYDTESYKDVVKIIEQYWSISNHPFAEKL